MRGIAAKICSAGVSGEARGEGVLRPVLSRMRNQFTPFAWFSACNKLSRAAFISASELAESSKMGEFIRWSSPKVVMRAVIERVMRM